jgi:hypothetical protein
MKNWKQGRKVIEVVCQNCGKLFQKAKSEYKRSEKACKKHFCSLNCSIEYHKKCAINMKNYCKFCGKEISYQKRYNTFCSSNCSASYNNKKRKGQKKHFSEKGIKNIIEANKRKYNVSEYYNNPNYCIECGKILEFAKKKQKFCDINCKRIFDRKNLNEYQKYYRKSQFNFNLNDFVDEFDFDLIKKFG